MRRVFLAAVLLLIICTTAQAEYVFMQFEIRIPKKVEGAPAPGPGPAAPPMGNPEEETIKLFLNAVVEVSKIEKGITGNNRQLFKVTHKWGKTFLTTDEILAARIIPLMTKARYNDMKSKAGKGGERKDYDQAEWCLNNGLLDEFVLLMDGLAKAGSKTGIDKLDRAVDAYTQVKAELAKRLDREDHSALWRSKLGFRMSQSDHYSVLYNATLSDPPEVSRRLALLEENMKAFYYWFALRGIVLPMPEQKMVAVLLDQPEQFKFQRELIEGEALVADSFYLSRDNVVVFSAQRLDTPSMIFNRTMQAYYSQGWDRDALLQGKSTAKLANKTNDDLHRMQTLALLDVALEAQAERASVTHDGTSQLIVSCGLQKPSVIMPGYLQFGMPAVFSTPKGPFPFAPVEVKVPYWHGWGGPSWEYTRIFRTIEQGGLAHDMNVIFRTTGETTTASETLRRVVTDSLFTRARDLGPIAGQNFIAYARTYAWGLCYFMAKDRPRGLIKLYEDLSKQPRDLELEPNELLMCFCRAFDLANATNTGPNPVAFESFATEWLGFMKTVPTPGAEYKLGLSGGASGPGGGGPPGGGPGGGGPGGGSPKGKGSPKGGPG